MTFHFVRGISAFVRGTDATVSGAPDQTIHAGQPVQSVALLGADCPGLRPSLAVAEGDQVRVGQVLFTDRKRPQIAFVAPVSGIVAAIEFGPRRMLSALIIRCSTEGPEPDADRGPVDEHDGEGVRRTLLARGFWPALLTRPFGRIPAPDARPEAIFVTATDSEPLAADPRVVLADQPEVFQRGVAALAKLTPGKVHVCQPPGSDLVASRGERIGSTTFAGPHPSGLAGTHIHRLHPVGEGGGEVWTIGYQDVLAIGHLYETGRYLAERVVSLSGRLIARPRLIRTVLGASLRDLTRGELERSAEGRPPRLLSGSILSGRDAAFLGRHHRQICVVEGSPAIRTPSLFDRIGARRECLHLRPLIPTSALERALPEGFLPVPLMRALSVGDVEAAQQLGCLALVEEDVALLSCLCTSGADYGALLRRFLDEAAEGA